VSQPQEEDLPQRLRDLERSRRRWKGLALGLLAFLAVLLGAGAGFSLVLTVRLRAERDRAVEAEMAAREHLRQAEAERDQAGRVHQQAGKGKGP
jgi:hypothetical protein